MEFELKQIKELMAAMGRSGITKLQLKQNDNELIIERGNERDASEASPRAVAMPVEMSGAHFPVHHAMPPAPTQYAGTAFPQSEESSEPEGTFVTSPMVGTMYHSPAPDEPCFIKVGDVVDEGTVVCIVEAMKVMNEVKAGVRGTVVEILIGNGQPVEYGTRLIRVVPS